MRPEEFLPTPLRLRREAEKLAEAVPHMRSEDEVRAAVSDINRRILQWRKIPDGPPVYVRLANKDAMLACWRDARGRPQHPPRLARPVRAPTALTGQPAATDAT